MKMLLLMALLAPQEPADWIEKLRDNDLAVREEAASALIDAGAVREVVPLLQDVDPEVAARALDILMGIGFPAIPLLEAQSAERVREVAGAIALDRAQAFLGGEEDAYAVEWNPPVRWKENALVEMGHGYGHGGSLEWYRFRHVKKGVEVLRVRLRIGYAKWHPDRPPVTLEKTVLDGGTYLGILRVLGAIRSAVIRRIQSRRHMFSTSDFWSSIRVREGEETLLAEEYAGYVNTQAKAGYAKALAATKFVRSILEARKFKPCALTASDRAWASHRFIRTSREYRGKRYYWWVYERGIILSGVVGDRSVLPTLREIIKGDPEKRPAAYAIHAATKLIGQDVREPAVEEMDVEATRRKLLPLLEEKK